MRTSAATTLAALVMVGCSQPETPQVSGPLVIDIPELCTVCIEVLDCESDDRHTIYVLQEKSAWAQIATIWDYFIQFFRPKTEDYRDLVAYSLSSDGQPSVMDSTGRARLDVWNRKVELPDAVVDQKTGTWIMTAGSGEGVCTHVERGEDRKRAAKLAEQVKAS